MQDVQFRKSYPLLLQEEEKFDVGRLRYWERGSRENNDDDEGDD